MNKILYTILALFCIGVTACDNDDSVVELSSLDIIEATVDFDAIGGEGFISLKNTGNVEIKASSSEEWCSIKNATNDKITFVVTPNGEITTRAAVIRISVSGEEKQVSVTQIGVVSQYDSDNFYSYADNVSFEKNINFTSTLPITVSIEDAAKSWLSYKEIEGGFTFSGVKNDTENGRMGKVTIKSGTMSVDYYFLQYDMEDLCAVWKASYSDGEELAADQITITNTSGNILNISIRDLRFSRIAAVYEDGAIKIPCMQIVGISNPYYIFLGTEDATGDNIGLDESITCQLSPCLNANGQWGLTFVDNGSWEYNMTGIIFWALTSDGNIAGYWTRMLNLSLSK